MFIAPAGLKEQLVASTVLLIDACASTMKTTIVYVTHDQIEAMTLGDPPWRCSRTACAAAVLDKPHEIYNNRSNVFVSGDFVARPGREPDPVSRSRRMAAVWVEC